MVSKIKTKKSVDKRKQVVVLTISRKAGSQLAARLADAADSVAVRAPTLVAVCVLAGVALGGLLTVLAPKAKEPTEHELLLASATAVRFHGCNMLL